MWDPLILLLMELVPLLSFVLYVILSIRFFITYSTKFQVPKDIDVSYVAEEFLKNQCNFGKMKVPIRTAVINIYT